MHLTACRVPRFISVNVYGQSGWFGGSLGKKYHGQRTLPPEMTSKLIKGELNRVIIL